MAATLGKAAQLLLTGAASREVRIRFECRVPSGKNILSPARRRLAGTLVSL